LKETKVVNENREKRGSVMRKSLGEKGVRVKHPSVDDQKA